MCKYFVVSVDYKTLVRFQKILFSLSVLWRFFFGIVQRAFAFEGTGLNQWNTANVEKMYNMFGQGEL